MYVQLFLGKVLWAVKLARFFKKPQNITVQGREPKWVTTRTVAKTAELVVFLGDWTGARGAPSSQPI